jgi:chromosome segregation ATPase
LAAALAVGCASLSLQAQTTPARPGALPAAAPTTSASAPTRGFGSARGPLLTRDELRACLSQDEDLKKRRAAHDAAVGPLEDEKKAIAEQQAAMRAERAKLDGGELNAAVTAFGQRAKVFEERRAKFEVRLKAYNDAGRTATAEEREAIEAERAELQKEHGALEAERKRVQGMQTALREAAQAYNAKIGPFEARVADWNKRQAAFNETGAAIESDRLAWAGSCGNRRYREDDELAIRQGK